jgi:hypothetical protein
MSQPETCPVEASRIIDQETWLAKGVSCPHCGSGNVVLINAKCDEHRTSSVEFCDPETGGCDRLFMVDGVFRPPTFVCTTHKIEGLGQ